MYWQCTVCGGYSAVAGEEDFPVDCCGVEHFYPIGLVETPFRARKAARKRDKRQRERQPAKRWPHGDELAELLKRLGAKQTTGCRCKAMIRNMNIWGPRCREYRHHIVRHLQDNYDHSTWADAAKFRARAVTSGLVLVLDWADPVGSLVDLAIERADEVSLVNCRLDRLQLGNRDQGDA